MQLRHYAITAVVLFIALGVVLSQPLEPEQQIAEDIVPDTVELSRSVPTENALDALPEVVSPELYNVTLGVATLLKEARDRGESDAYIQDLLDKASASGQLHTKKRITANTGQVKEHVVQEGESLASIAEQNYGSPEAFMLIYDANRAVLNSPNHVLPGQVLRLP